MHRGAHDVAVEKGCCASGMKVDQTRTEAQCAVVQEGFVWDCAPGSVENQLRCALRAWARES